MNKNLKELSRTLSMILLINHIEKEKDNFKITLEKKDIMIIKELLDGNTKVHKVRKGKSNENK